jgi:ribonuclease D
MKVPMNPPKLIAAQRELDKFIEQISRVKYLAVDSESNSYFAYRPRICLIQISANNTDFILDPLTLKDLTGLGPILADPSVQTLLASKGTIVSR